MLSLAACGLVEVCGKVLVEHVIASCGGYNDVVAVGCHAVGVVALMLGSILVYVGNLCISGVQVACAVEADGSHKTAVLLGRTSHIHLITSYGEVVVVQFAVVVLH